LGTTSKDCSYYLVSCDGLFLGDLSLDKNNDLSIAYEPGLYGSAGSDVSILNPLGSYGRDFTSCSAFNETAAYPPEVICSKANGTQELAGYLTLNQNISERINACRVLTNLGLSHPACE
jgi:hypothetical protein